MQGTPTTLGGKMGMDVYGKEPQSKEGEYFRNNIWYWRPLWGYCCEVADDIIGKELADVGFSNNGHGLDSEGAVMLAERLFQEIESGKTAEWKKDYDAQLAALPMEPCKYCEETGIRTDKVGVTHGMSTRELSEDMAIILGRTHGTCNACNGVGKKPAFATSYPFEVENVLEFANFCKDSGGFQIC
jgi:hypothetical protein